MDDFSFVQLAYEHLGNHSTALENYTRALDSDPETSFSARLSRAKLYSKFGQLQNALEDFRQLERIKPDHAEVVAWRQQVQQELAAAERPRVSFSGR